MRKILSVVAVLGYSTCLFAQKGAVSGGHASAPAGHVAAGHAAVSHVFAPSWTGSPSHLGPASTNRAMQAGNWTSSGFIPSPNFHGHYNHERHFGYGYGVAGYPVYALPYGYLNGGLDLDDNDPNDPNQQAAAPAGNAYADNSPSPVPYVDQQGYPAQGYPYGPAPAARAPYDPNGMSSGPYTGMAQTPKSDGLVHPMVTLVLKNGRQIKIQNYAMTKTRLFVTDNGTERDIAISDIDVPATTAANDEAGVDFTLPTVN